MVTRKQEISLPKDVGMILEILQNNSKNSIIVGGAIRDTLLGLTPKDYDFATDMEYDKLLEIFKDYAPKEIGKSFGIIQIKVNGIHYEIAKFRKDIGLSDDRTKQQIEFTSSLEEDLKRRDFTMNSIGYDGVNLITIDESHFIDIEYKTVVFVGNPYDRIKEDPLRLLRMIRFACTKNLVLGSYILGRIESLKTWIKESGVMNSLSKERIRDEFVKILMSDNPRYGLNLLSDFGILELILPNADKLDIEQNNPHHNKNIKEHLFKAVECCQPILELRLSALLHDIAKPSCFTIDENGVGHFYGHDKLGEEVARSILCNLKFENKTIDIVCKLVRNHMNKKDRQTPKAMRKLINKVGVENIPMLFQLMEADIIASKPPYNFKGLDNMKILFHEIMNENNYVPCLKITDLKVNGDDLIKLGYEGKEIGDKLKELHELVLEKGSSENTFKNLIEKC